MSFITKESLYTSRDIKIEAKAQLKGNWKNAILLAIIPIVFSIFFVGETEPEMVQMSTGRGLLNIVLRLIHSFMLVSVSFTFLDFLRNQKKINPLEGAFQAFKKEYFVNLLLLKALKYIYTILWTFLLIIPGIVKSYSYSQAELIYKDKVDRTGEIPKPGDCIKESQIMMDGYKMDLFSLFLSFIGWYILSFLSFGLLFIWLTPYIEMSQVVFYENLLGKKNNSDQYREKNYEEIGQDPDDFRDFEDF